MLEGGYAPALRPEPAGKSYHDLSTPALPANANLGVDAIVSLQRAVSMRCSWSRNRDIANNNSILG